MAKIAQYKRKLMDLSHRVLQVFVSAFFLVKTVFLLYQTTQHQTAEKLKVPGAIFSCFYPFLLQWFIYVLLLLVLFLAGADQTGDSEEKWLRYPSGRRTSPCAAGHHSVWTQCSHPVQGKCVQTFPKSWIPASFPHWLKPVGLKTVARFQMRLKWALHMLQF